jgi:hypothetical protein
VALVTAALALLLSAGTATLTDPAGATSEVPAAPTSVTAVQAGPSADVTVSWTPSTSAPTATGALVQLYNNVNGGFDFLTKITCGASCTSSIFRNLSFGTAYEAFVTPTDAAGSGAATMSNTVTPSTTCTAGACVTIDGTSDIGPTNHAASGILDSVFNVGQVVQDMTLLDTTMFRGVPTYNTNGTLDWNNWNLATESGAQTTLVLSSLWSASNNDNPPTPWSGWTTYNSFITSTVSTILASGEQVNYWEVFNEPGQPGYYSAANYATVTPALLLQQFLETDQDIKSVDPGAAIIGPSLSDWQDYPNQYGTVSSPEQGFDMDTFLNFAAANNLQLAAISWHEIDNELGPNPEENVNLPAIIEDHVAEARRLIASLPALGHPMIFINEYGSPDVQAIPGWDVAYLSALTDAGVNYAGRSCWNNDCAVPTLDGLLATDGATTMPDFWVRYFYSLMSGNMLPTSSSSDWVTALGSYNSTTNEITALVGRGEGCTQDANCATDFPSDTPQPATSTTIELKVPWTAGSVKVNTFDIQGQNIGPYPLPAAVPSIDTITTTGANQGIVSITIPSFADGDAYAFTVTPYVLENPAVAQFYGSTGALSLNKPIVGMAATPDSGGYWLVAADGGIFNYGDARFYGSTGALNLNKPIVGMASTPDGKGYWLVASDGGIFNYGDAQFYGSTGALNLNKPIVGMASTPDGKGYWLVASDGGIFNFGDAQFYGSTGALNLNKPIVGMASSSDGKGYWLVASDGGIFNFGDALFNGSTGAIHLNKPIVGMAAAPVGYWLVASDGGIFSLVDSS